MESNRLLKGCNHQNTTQKHGIVNKKNIASSQEKGSPREHALGCEVCAHTANVRQDLRRIKIIYNILLFLSLERAPASSNLQRTAIPQNTEQSLRGLFS